MQSSSATMAKCCILEVDVNGLETFLVDKVIACSAFSLNYQLITSLFLCPASVQILVMVLPVVALTVDNWASAFSHCEITQLVKWTSA